MNSLLYYAFQFVVEAVLEEAGGIVIEAFQVKVCDVQPEGFADDFLAEVLGKFPELVVEVAVSVVFVCLVELRWIRAYLFHYLLSRLNQLLPHLPSVRDFLEKFKELQPLWVPLRAHSLIS